MQERVDGTGMILESLYMSCKRYNASYKKVVRQAEDISRMSSLSLTEAAAAIEVALHSGVPIRDIESGRWFDDWASAKGLPKKRC